MSDNKIATVAQKTLATTATKEVLTADRIALSSAK